MINVETTKNQNENTPSVMRRFTKRMQSSGVLQRARSLRYYAKPASRMVKKKSALKSIERKQKYTELAKLGKIKPEKRGSRR